MGDRIWSLKEIAEHVGISQSVVEQIPNVKSWLSLQRNKPIESVKYGLFRVAAANANSAVVKALLAQGVSPTYWEFTTSEAYLESPFMAAITKGDASIIGLCLEYGADVNSPDGRGRLPLHMAVRSGSPLACKLLLDSGARINARSDHGDIALHDLMWRGDPAAVAVMLIEHGADLDARDKSSRTPLHNAACYSRRGAPVLIQHGADIHAVDDHGGTPLHNTVELANVEVAQMLIERGANVNAKDNKGYTPLDYALANKKYRKSYKYPTPEDANFLSATAAIVALLRRNGGKKRPRFRLFWRR